LELYAPVGALRTGWSFTNRVELHELEKRLRGFRGFRGKSFVNCFGLVVSAESISVRRCPSKQQTKTKTIEQRFWGLSGLWGKDKGLNANGCSSPS
jgi:hypothetical protein